MEKEIYTAYDLEEQPEAPAPLKPKVDENDDNADNAENNDNAENSENDENNDNAKAKIEKMIDEMGAEKLLEIINGNRNSAIRQIISEAAASNDNFIPSGTSVARTMDSIFDLAALA